MVLNWSWVIYLIVGALIFGLLWWFVGWLAGKGVIQEPFIKIIQVVLMLVGVIFLINILLGLTGHAFIQIR